MNKFMTRLQRKLEPGSTSTSEIRFKDFQKMIPEGYSFFISDTSDSWFVEEDDSDEPRLLIQGPLSKAIEDSLGWSKKTIKDAGKHCIFRLLPARKGRSKSDVTLFLTITRKRTGKAIKW